MQNIKVMVVEDNEIDREIFCYKLKMVGITRICEKKDGADALAYFEALCANGTISTHPLPAVIFLDIQMPNMDGFEFLKQFNVMIEEVGFKPPLVVMHSSSDYIEEVNRAKQYAFVVNFLVKGKVNSDKLNDIFSLLINEQNN